MDAETKSSRSRFDAWSFVRTVLDRGTAIERDSEAQGRGYEVHSAHLDKVAREFAERLRPHLTERPADDEELADGPWLKECGGIWSDLIQAYLFRNADDLVWVSESGRLDIGTYMIRVEDCTRGEVRSLCSILRIPFPAPTPEEPPCPAP